MLLLYNELIFNLNALITELYTVFFLVLDPNRLIKSILQTDTFPIKKREFR